MVNPEKPSGPATCCAQGCGDPASGLMCARHLAMVPPGIRHVIASSADPAACPPAILAAAIDAVAHKETRSAPRTPRPQPPAPRPSVPKPAKAVRKPVNAGRKPVQLALFDV